MTTTDHLDGPGLDRLCNAIARPMSLADEVALFLSESDRTTPSFGYAHAPRSALERLRAAWAREGTGNIATRIEPAFVGQLRASVAALPLAVLGQGDNERRIEE